MIYFDQAATTKPYKEAIQAAVDGMVDLWGNPSSAHTFGYEVRERVEEARKAIANSINADPEEIFFTSGSTEGLNWFIKELEDYKVYTTPIEHPAILNSIVNYSMVKLDKNTVPVISDIPENSIAVMAYVNNEIGTLLPLNEFQERHVVVMLDATQAYGHIPIDVKKEKLDLMVGSGHKLHTQKGIGFIYISKEMQESATKNYPMLFGGGQERGFRAGTENVPGILALGVAVEKTLENRKEKNRKIEEIRNYMYGDITNNIKCAHLNGTANWQKRWAGNLNFRFDGYKGEELLAWFDQHNICVSTGSACSSHSGEPSHVLKAIGLTDEEAESSIRFSFDETNTIHEAREVIRVLKEGLEVLHHD